MRSLPIFPEAFASLELPLTQKASGAKPAKWRFCVVHGYKSLGFLALLLTRNGSFNHKLFAHLLLSAFIPESDGTCHIDRIVGQRESPHWFLAGGSKLLITRLREVRKAKRMTLEDVARACSPPTTPQTIGRLETGMRTVSIGWLNRIAAALGVAPTDLVDHPASEQLKVLALLASDSAAAPKKAQVVLPPRPEPTQVALLVTASVGDYRAGDEIWCDRLEPEAFPQAMNRDILVPRPGGRFQFGRLLARDGGKLHLLPVGSGARQMVVNDPPWLAMPVRLVRSLG